MPYNIAMSSRKKKTKRSIAQYALVVILLLGAFASIQIVGSQKSRMDFETAKLRMLKAAAMIGSEEMYQKARTMQPQSLFQTLTFSNYNQTMALALNQKALELQQEAQRLEEERQAQQQAALDRQNQERDTAWRIDYTEALFEEADSNGRITRWNTDHYIAHAWSVNGKKIAEKPALICVDDLYYRFNDSRIFADGEDYSAYVDGYLILQTCTDEGYALLCRYEKADELNA